MVILLWVVCFYDQNCFRGYPPYYIWRAKRDWVTRRLKKNIFNYTRFCINGYCAVRFVGVITWKYVILLSTYIGLRPRSKYSYVFVILNSFMSRYHTDIKVCVRVCLWSKLRLHVFYLLYFIFIINNANTKTI